MPGRFLGIMLVVALILVGCAQYSGSYRYAPYGGYYHYPYGSHGFPGHQGYGYRGE